jgi:predicted PurR-regulated permease PerM
MLPSDAVALSAIVAQADSMTIEMIRSLREQLPVTVTRDAIEGVEVHRVAPAETDPRHDDHLFVYVHGGAFVLNGGEASLVEPILIAHRTGMQVLSIDYRMPPSWPAPASTAIGVVNFFGAYVPYLGAFFGGAFAVLMALGDGGLSLALLMLALTLGVNLILENLLQPVLIGGSLSIGPLPVLLATTFGGMLAGMVGLVLAAPTLAIVLDARRELKAAGFFDEPGAATAPT